MKASDEPKGHEGEGSQEPANEPLAAFGQRGPLLSDADIGKMSVTENGFAGENKYRMARRVRAFYEAKISSGELRTEETTTFKDFRCVRCGYEYRSQTPSWKYCPGCSRAILGI